MKVYLAGPMTGIPYFNFPEFYKHAHTLRKQGHEVFSPAEHDCILLDKPTGWIPDPSDSVGPWVRWAMPNAPTLRRMLGDDLKWIASEAEAIYLMPGWENSKGVQAEWALGKALGLKMVYINGST